MSYLDATGPGFSQAVISLWFKVPKDSLTACKNARTGEPGKILDGIVPLVVMGKEGTNKDKTHTEKKKDVLTFTSSGTQCSGGLVDIEAHCTEVVGTCCKKSLITHTYECTCEELGPFETKGGQTQETTVTGSGKPRDPSFIGVTASGKLFVNFESTKVPEVNPGYEISSITPGSASGGQTGECKSGTSSFGCDVLSCFGLIIECSNTDDNGNGEDNTTPSPPAHDGTEVATKNNYTKIPGNMETGAIYSDKIKAGSDKWHHVLISVDLKPIKTHGLTPSEDLPEGSDISKYVDSAAKLFIALDDNNYTKDKLSDNWVDGGGDNDVLTDGGWEYAASIPFHGDSESPEYGAINTYSLSDSSVPDGYWGLPAVGKYVDSVYHCEMAEFQMWIGKTLDTNNEKLRRVFLDFQYDENKKAIPDSDGKARLKPVDPKVAADLLGPPNFLLHGASKWIKGKNTGTGGSFGPTGIIKRYKPDPAVLQLPPPPDPPPS